MFAYEVLSLTMVTNYVGIYLEQIPAV